MVISGKKKELTERIKMKVETFAKKYPQQSLHRLEELIDSFIADLSNKEG